MSLNPFRADTSIRDRIAALDASIGDAVRADVADAIVEAVLAGADVEAIRARHGLTVEELMLLTLPVASAIARPPVSDFFVGVVGLERETGALVYGGNLEFPGGHLGYTVHGEGFVITRAFHRGTAIATLAISEAHPCAYCRQYLSEFAATAQMTLIDPLGHRLTMQDLYPWPFDPDYLGAPGIAAGKVNNPDLALAANRLPPDVAAALTDRGRKAWAPYSKCPGAVALVLSDGTIISSSSIESVSFNPTMAPLPAALIELGALGRDYEDITAAYLATTISGNVDYSKATADLLNAVAPGVPLTITAWQ